MDRRDFLLNVAGITVFPGGETRTGESRSNTSAIAVGDDRLQVFISFGPDGLRETEYRVDQISLSDMEGDPWGANVGSIRVLPRGHPASMLICEGGVPARRAVFEADSGRLIWRLEYAVLGHGRITKSLTLTSKRRLMLDTIVMWRARSRIDPHVSRTGMQDIAAFYRQEGRSLFVSLDFPYSEITAKKGLTEVSYSPFTNLDTGHAYACHSLTFGSARLTGESRYGYDVGEVEAINSYVQERFEPRFKRPMFVTSSIVNRYTQVRGDTIFYTMKDQPTLRFNRKLLRRDLQLMPQLGVEYYQVFPGVFDWVPGDPAPNTVQEYVNYAHSQGIRIGDYSASNYLFCPHFNEYDNSLDRPDWLILDRDGKSNGNPFCFGDTEFVDFYIGTVVPNCRRFGFEIHCLDFLKLKPCYATHHGHPPGRKSLYSQVRGLVRLLEALDGVSPQMMTWSNSGDWSELLPKLAWSNPNLYLTDPFIKTAWQGLNMTRLLDDARREQMVALHHTHFLPYRFFTNCQYFFCQNSVVPDIRNFKYGVLSTLAVTPNLALGEIRPWIDRLSPFEQQEVIRFYKDWTSFVHDNFDLWKNTFQVGENPGVGSVEIYSHAARNHGFVFIVNPQYWDRTVGLPLDSSLGFDASGRCVIRELYPVRRLRLTAQGPFASFGTTLPVKVDAQQVLVLEVKAAAEEIHAPTLFGLPGMIEQSQDGFLIKTHGAQGHSERFAVMLPAGSTPICSARVRRDVPKQPKRQWAATPLKLLTTSGPNVLMKLTFRKSRAPTQLRTWVVRPGSLSSGVHSGWSRGLPGGQKLEFPLFVDTSAVTLPITDVRANELGLGPIANFLAAYIDHAFSEDQETWIELKVGGQNLQQGTIASQECLPIHNVLHPLARDPRRQWWLETSFYLPFINSDGTEPRPENHPQLIVPMIRREQLKKIRAWINGIPLAIRQYSYPRNRKLGCFHADLMGSGAQGQYNNRLVIFLEY